MPNPPADISGQRFGRLVAISGRNRRWLFRCDCGAEVVTSITRVRRGESKSCGCLARDLTRERFRRHGQSFQKTPEYSAWEAMKSRCYNPNSKNFPRYGGRGITVCDEWRENFDCFYADMGPRPEGLSIDRIDNDGPYAKWNCRWTTRRVQINNRRNTTKCEYNGRMVPLTRLAEAFGANPESLRQAIDRGENAADAARRLGAGRRHAS